MALSVERPTGWDGVGVVTRRDTESGATILMALHSEKLGPSTGGTRMAVYADGDAALRDALRLAEGMTNKWAADPEKIIRFAPNTPKRANPRNPSMNGNRRAVGVALSGPFIPTSPPAHMLSG